jgi:hypothetical protein
LDVNGRLLDHSFSRFLGVQGIGEEDLSLSVEN